MARPLRLEYPGALYHVMNSGLACRATFRTPTDSATFSTANLGQKILREAGILEEEARRSLYFMI